MREAIRRVVVTLAAAFGTTTVRLAMSRSAAKAVAAVLFQNQVCRLTRVVVRAVPQRPHGAR
jgi:hypothetical protein